MSITAHHPKPEENPLTHVPPACLPIIKPTFYWCFGRFAPPASKFASTSGPGTGRRSRGYGRSGGKQSFHLYTLPDEEEKDRDGGASTRWLNDASLDRAPPPDLEGYERRRQGRIQTTITGRGSSGDDGDGKGLDGRTSEGTGDRGIQVHNETIMCVSYSRPKLPNDVGVEPSS